MSAITVIASNNNKLDTFPIFNPFDEAGLLTQTPRLWNEDNISYKERIKDVFRKPSNTTLQGLVNGLSREFGLTPYNVRDKKFYYLSQNPADYSSFDLTWEEFIDDGIEQYFIQHTLTKNVHYIVHENPTVIDGKYSRIIELLFTEDNISMPLHNSRLYAIYDVKDTETTTRKVQDIFVVQRATGPSGPEDIELYSMSDQEWMNTIMDIDSESNTVYTPILWNMSGAVIQDSAGYHVFTGNKGKLLTPSPVVNLRDVEINVSNISYTIYYKTSGVSSVINEEPYTTVHDSSEYTHIMINMEDAANVSSVSAALLLNPSNTNFLYPRVKVKAPASFINTRIEKWANEARVHDRGHWGTFIWDKSYWGTARRDYKDAEFLPFLLDPEVD